MWEATMTITKPLAGVLLLAAFGTGTASAQGNRQHLRMRVVSTRASQHQVVVSTAVNSSTTKGIKTETYEVRDTTMLATMKPGDVISADVVVSGRQSYLENVSKESAQPQAGTGIVPSTDTVGMSGARGSTFGHDTT